MKTRPADHRQPDRGAALILALAFLTLGSFVVLALANYASANLANTSNFRAQRYLEYAADGAMNSAIQAIRYEVGTTDTTCSTVYYPGSTSSVTINGVPIHVSCSQFITGPQPGEDTVTLNACAWNGAVCTSSSIITAQVAYTYIDPNGAAAPGFGVGVQSWVVNTANG